MLEAGIPWFCPSCHAKKVLDLQQQWQWDTSTQLIGQFLIDQGGIVRWVNIECAREGAAGLGKFPTEDELLAAARALST